MGILAERDVGPDRRAGGVRLRRARNPEPMTAPQQSTRLRRLARALGAPFRPLARLEWSDLWILAGFASTGYGLWQVHEPTAWIVCGLLLLAYGLRMGGVGGIDLRAAGAGARGARNPRQS